MLINRLLYPIVISVIFISCSSVKYQPKYQLSDDTYVFKQKGVEPIKVFMDVKEDTFEILTLSKEPLKLKDGKDAYFIKKSLDVDVLTILFKFRPSQKALPRQLNTNFNGNVFVGYRIDRFRIHYKKTLAGLQKELHHSGLTVGGFGGFGAATINPWTTNNQTTDEYDGFVLTRGLAVMVAVNQLTIGLATGWDYLTDRDKNIWIYQNKPWFGVTLSLNVN